jgi:hypothetical protein
MLSTEDDEDSGFLNCIMNRLMPPFQGFFVVSIHEKIEENSFKLLYPKKKDKQNLNLLLLNDFIQFANICGNELPNLRKYSNILPSAREFIDVDKKIENNTTLTSEQKEIQIEQMKDDFYQLISRWNLTIKGNAIESIKLSVMINFIKKIVGPTCKINLLDYSCNAVSMFVPKNQLPKKQYMIENDMEEGYSKTWGGKPRSKKYYKKYNYKFKKHKKSRRHNKKARK